VDRLAYTFTRTGSLAAAVTINFAVGGTATYLTDYTVTGAASFAATAGSVRFAAGASTSVIYVTPKNDANYEPDETVVLTVKPTLGYFAGPSPATGTIINDDIEVTVAVAPSSVLEDSGNSLVYTFTRRGVLTNVVTANFSISGTATLNTDYTFGGAVLNGLNGAVTFAPGAETVQVTATPISDAVNESNETVIVTVGTGFGYLPAAVKTATGTVANDDPQVSVWPAPSPVYEDSGSKMIFTFTRTGPLNQYLTVNFAVNGTAVYGVDYTQTGAATFGTTSGTVRFVLGASVVQVVITPKSDKTVEPDETVSLIVQGGTGYFVGSLIVATTTIR
ncbi:MAG TPA: Calx-beta domain-containing protein, partial [Pirellulaceae bacterium]|nr:Calx-beta domain-containing protein [Pirellulaceae bacterium]